MILFSPTREKIEHAVHFEFSVTNNAVEYEVVISAAKLAGPLGAADIIIHKNSKVLANQIPGRFLSKEDSMSAYLEVF